MDRVAAAANLPSLAVTKLRAPTLHDHVLTRPSIDALLDRAIDTAGSLVLASAPPGAGKSTALAAWLRGRPDLASAWIQVDEADNDPIRFWSALTLGIDAIEPGIESPVLTALRAPNTSFVEGALPALVNALDNAQTMAVVLDDYHLIDSQEIHVGLESLIEALPDHVTLLISTRIDPPLRLGRLRVRGTLTEIRTNHLRFNANDAACFFAAGTLSGEEINTLCVRTEGWAAGLALAAASLVGRSDPTSFVEDFAGDHRMVADYLAAELWEGVRDADQQTMLATSILDQMCGPLVEAVAGIDDGSGWLERSARQNQLLIPLDSSGHWYRFHHFLRDLLRSELVRSDPARLSELHRRAAAWFMANGAFDAAIRHLFDADDLPAAAELVGAQGSKIFSEGELATVQGWLDRLGIGLVSERPWCSVLQVWTMVVAGNFVDVDPWIRTSEELIAEGAAGADRAFLAGSIGSALALSSIAHGNVGTALAAAERIAATPDDHEITPLVSGIVGICRTWAGRHDEALPFLESSARHAPLDGEHLIACTSTMFLAILAMENGDPGRAAHFAQRSLEHAESHHLSEYHQIALADAVLARVSFDDDPTAAAVHAERGVTLARRSNEPIMLAYALISRAEVADCDGRDEHAQIDLVEARRLLDRCQDPGMVLTFLARREASLGSVGGYPLISTRSGLVEELTGRELTVLRLLPSELTLREIGGELYVSQNTVKGHVKSIYRKLAVNGRSLAIQRARELKLL